MGVPLEVYVFSDIMILQHQCSNKSHWNQNDLAFYAECSSVFLYRVIPWIPNDCLYRVDLLPDVDGQRIKICFVLQFTDINLSAILTNDLPHMHVDMRYTDFVV